MPRRPLLAPAAAALIAAGCGGSDSKEASATRTPAAAATPAATKPQVQVPRGKLPNRLVIKDLRKGTGAVAKDGKTVTVQYVGVSALNGRQFDASWDRGQPFSFQLPGQVIQGWNKGVPGMRVGGRRELIIPPSLGYGAQGSGPIGPNETLVFVIDLLKVS
jgi:peptidylprolyl isomerase